MHFVGGQGGHRRRGGPRRGGGEEGADSTRCSVTLKTSSSTARTGRHRPPVWRRNLHNCPPIHKLRPTGGNHACSSHSNVPASRVTAGDFAHSGEVGPPAGPLVRGSIAPHRRATRTGAQPARAQEFAPKSPEHGVPVRRASPAQSPPSGGRRCQSGLSRAVARSERDTRDLSRRVQDATRTPRTVQHLERRRGGVFSALRLFPPVGGVSLTWSC